MATTKRRGTKAAPAASKEEPPAPSVEAEPEMTVEHPAPAIVPMLPHTVEALWPKLEDQVREAINASTVQPKLETPRDVLQALLDGRYMLHVITAESAIQVFLISTVQVYDRAAVCVIVYGGGRDVPKWLEHFKIHFSEQAREWGCRFIQIQAPNPQWADMLEALEFKETARVMSLEI